MDLGTCRKQDLFVTSETMKEKLEDFVIMDFKNQDEQDFSDLLALYNNGEIKEGQQIKIRAKVKEYTNRKGQFNYGIEIKKIYW